MDDIFNWDGVAGCLALLVAEASCSALLAADVKKLRSAVAGRSALPVGGSALSVLLGAAEAGRFMAALRKMQS